MFTDDDIEAMWLKIRRRLGIPDRVRVKWLPDISEYKTRPDEGDFFCGEGCCGNKDHPED